MAATAERDAAAEAIRRRRWRLWAREADRLALWAPVALGLGVAGYFALASEPALWVGMAAAALSAAAFGARARVGAIAARALLAAAGLAALGFGAAQFRAWSAAAPVLEAPGRHVVEGRVAAVGSDARGRPRALLDRVAIAGLAAAETPRRIRVRLRAPPEIGRRIRVAARLAPPPGPAEPGAFDFRRAAWFQGLGAVGAARGSATDLGPAALAAGWRGWVDRGALWLARLRARLSAEARAAVAAAGYPGDEGPVIAALLFGDRAGLAPETVSDLRDANLAHLLAISGLHMGLVCLTIFGAARAVLSLSAPLGVRADAKKIAAVAGLLAGAAYLGLAGGALPTQRAFIMAAVAFGAVLAGRPAVTLRAVAVAAGLILLVRPESLFDAGFQLSFAATTAMVAFFEASRALWRQPREGGTGLARSVGLWAAALFAASLVAGLATAPFAAAAFDRVSRYGLLANLLAVPTMGLWIMPMGLIALALTPFGWAAPAYAAMAAGVAYVLAVAETVSGWPGAVRTVAAAPEGALAVLSLGALQLCLWRGLALRALGLAGVGLGLWLWQSATRPTALVSPGARLVGVATVGAPPRRALDRPRADRFAAALWLRRDGDPASVEAAAARAAFARFRGGWVARTPEGWRIVMLLYPRLDRRDAQRDCRGPTLILAPRGDWAAPKPARARRSAASRRGAAPIARSVAPEGARAPCLLIDRSGLATAGALSIRFERIRAEESAAGMVPIGGARIQSSAARAGDRPWSAAPVRRRWLRPSPGGIRSDARSGGQ